MESNPERIWNQYQNAERASRYYSRLHAKHEKRYKKISFCIALAIVIVLFLLQQDEWLQKLDVPVDASVSVILLIVAGIELWLIHFDYPGQVKAIKMMSVQAGLLASQYRALWYHPEEHESNFLIDFLERQLFSIGGEPIPVDEKLNNDCAEEVVNEFEKGHRNEQG